MTRHTRKPSARRAATRQRLLDGARQVFAEHGVNGATVEDICEAAGFTRGAFYSNFEAKEDLVVALMTVEEERIVAALTEAIGRSRTERSSRSGRSHRSHRSHRSGHGEPETPETPEDSEASRAPQEYDLGGVVDLFVTGQPVDREHALMQSEFRLYAMRNPQIAARLSTGRDAFLAQLAALFDDGLERAGRRATIPTADAVLMLVSVCETGLRDELTRSAEDWEGLPGLAMLLLTLIEAITQDVDPHDRPAP